MQRYVKEYKIKNFTAMKMPWSAIKHKNVKQKNFSGKKNH